MSEAVDVTRASLTERAYLQPPAAVWRGIAAAAADPSQLSDVVVELPTRGATVEPEVGAKTTSWLPIAALIVVVLAVLALLGLVVL